jgi:hypothetical protein
MLPPTMQMSRCREMDPCEKTRKPRLMTGGMLTRPSRPRSARMHERNRKKRIQVQEQCRTTPHTKPKAKKERKKEPQETHLLQLQIRALVRHPLMAHTQLPSRRRLRDRRVEEHLARRRLRLQRDELAKGRRRRGGRRSGARRAGGGVLAAWRCLCESGGRERVAYIAGGRGGGGHGGRR